MALKISVLSTEYIRVPVSAEDSGAPVDVTTATARFAFVDFATDADPAVWFNGAWETDPGPPIVYYARILIGPTGETIAVGKYHIWLEVAHSPEIPIRLVGVLTVE